MPSANWVSGSWPGDKAQFSALGRAVMTCSSRGDLTEARGGTGRPLAASQTWPACEGSAAPSTRLRPSHSTQEAQTTTPTYQPGRAGSEAELPHRPHWAIWHFFPFGILECVCIQLPMKGKNFPVTLSEDKQDMPQSYSVLNTNSRICPREWQKNVAVGGPPPCGRHHDSGPAAEPRTGSSHLS